MLIQFLGLPVDSSLDDESRASFRVRRRCVGDFVGAAERATAHDFVDSGFAL